MGDLFDELVLRIFSYLNAKDLTHCSLVCKQWRRISKSQSLWRRLVLVGWPSQEWLYKKIGVYQLNWYKIFQEFTQASWFSPDDMKYFIYCKTIEDEPHSHQLREAMFRKMAEVIGKWYQVLPADPEINPVVDKNMELYYDTCQLQWVFLDRRRSYLDSAFPNKLLSSKGAKRSRHIRPYQVIPSCVVMYRWLAMFGSLANTESGLTFYRVWRFKLRHFETGITFELSDWKAAMSSSFSAGRPLVASYRNDALELLQVLTHRHFIMHPFGLNPSVEKSCYFTVSAAAGGLLRKDPLLRVRFHRRSRKRKGAPLTPTSPGNQTFSVSSLGKQMFDSSVYDIDERLERWRARRQLAMLGGTSMSTEGKMSRQSSCSSLFSDPDSTTEDDSLRETETTSDCDSENGFCDSGYVTNCDHFISNSHSFDTIEEQHSFQATLADDWTWARNAPLQKTRVLFDVDDRCWYLESLLSSPPRPRASQELTPNTKRKCLENSNRVGAATARISRLKLMIPANSDSTQGSPPPSPSDATPQDPLSAWVHKSNVSAQREEADSGVIEAIPSPLALYRLICLFDLNCAMYVSPDDGSVWEINMRHIKTGGIIHIKDFNGSMYVYISARPPSPPLSPDDLSGSNDSADEMDESPPAARIEGDFDFSEFRTAVIQLLDLLVDENFCHPYGTIAGAVA